VNHTASSVNHTASSVNRTASSVNHTASSKPVVLKGNVYFYCGAFALWGGECKERPLGLKVQNLKSLASTLLSGCDRTRYIIGNM